MKYLLLLLSGLEISDGIMTNSLVGNGLLQEANPLMTSIVGDGDFLLLKVVGALLSALALWQIYRRFPRLALTTTSSVLLFYSAVLAWNLGVFLGA